MYNNHERHEADQNDRNIEVSIIIPSFNKYPLNLFTLYSLELQTIDPSKLEVILIDDGSTDQTSKSLQNYNPPYHFYHIRNQQNKGRSAVRNIGIKAARGNILIFLDAEMITEPDFVMNHLKYHQDKNNVVATGFMHSKPVYTCAFPDFSSKTMNRIAALSNNKLKQNVKEPYPLIRLKDISSGAYKKFALKTFPWFRNIISNYNANLEGFEFPWMAFITGNVSIRKQLVEQAGYFDEDFVNYGYEDWELGYRLSKLGAKFMIGRDLGAYHQEHPVSENKWKEAVGNYGLFTIKHFEVETLILSLELSHFVDLIGVNDILKEYKLLIKTEPQKFADFQERFMAILETINLFLHSDIRPLNILGATGFGTEHVKALSEDIISLKHLGVYRSLVNFLESLMHSKSAIAGVE